MRALAIAALVLCLAAATAPIGQAEEPVDPVAELQAQLDAEHAARLKAEAEVQRMTRLAYLRRLRNQRLVQLMRNARAYRYEQMLHVTCHAARLSAGQCWITDGIVRCESGPGRGHKPSPNAKNPSSSASGFGQFLDSTWRSTRWKRFSVFDPFANLFAVAEWVRAGLAYVHWQASAGCWS